MNSLNDLNGSTVTVEYSDYRPAGVEFNTTTPVNQTLSKLEGQTYTAPVGINIIDVVDYATCAVTYTVNVSAQPGATVTWPTIPAGCTVTNPSTGVYRINGINSAYIWNQVKNPTITPDPDYYGTWVITSTINYLSTLSKSWTTTVTVTNVVELSTPSEFWFVTGSNLITGNPTMLDTANPVASWQLFVSVNPTVAVSTLSTAGSGGTSSFNSTTKLLTITGTNAQINSHLNSLTFVTNGTLEQDVVFTYTAQKISTLETDTQSQNVRCALIRYLSPLTDFTYNEDASKLITGSPLVTDLYAAGTPSYTVTVTPSITSAVKTLSSAGAGGTSSFNTSTKRLSITGTKAQVNSHLAAITLVPGVDYTTIFTLTYAITPPDVLSPGTLSKNQLAIIDQTHAEDTNYTLSRDYLIGVSNSIFATNTPQITDTDPLATSYTIGLSVPVGVGTFSAPGTTTSRTWTYTGTKTQCNALFSQISFTPATNYFLNTTMTYTQTKLSPTTVSQINQAVALNGPDVAFDITLPGSNQTISQDEAQTHNVPYALNVIGVNDAGTTAPTYTINVNALAGCTVTWTTIPSGCVVTNPSTGVYTINNVTAANWSTIRAPRINVPLTYFGVFNYIATVSWNSGANTTSWTVTATVNDDVTFSQTTPSAQSISTSEGASHTALYGTEITRVYNTANETAPSYTIDLANAPGSTVTWATIPSGCSVSNPTANSYRISGIDSTAKWTTVRAPTIQLNNYTSGSITYTSTITYSGGLTKSWVTTATITNEDTLTNATAFVYYSGTTQTVTGVPQVVDTGVQTPTWTVTVTPSDTTSVTLLASSGTGGLSSFNGTSKVLTISGTKTEVNTHLSNISLSSATGRDLDYTMTYTATASNGETSTKTQSLSSNNYTVLSAVASSMTYTTDQVQYISGNPTITDSSADGSGTYTLTIQPNPTAALSSIAPEFPLSVSTSNIVTMDSYNNILVYGFTASGTGQYGVNVYNNNTGSQMSFAGTPEYDSGDDFGSSVAIYGDWLAIGASETAGVINNGSTSGSAGIVYIFKLISGVWTYQQSLYQSAEYGGALFGAGLAMSNNRLLVGAPGFGTASETNRPGRVFAYELSGSTWSLSQTITSSDVSNNLFGEFIAMDGNTAVISRATESKVYVYSGSSWSIQTNLPYAGFSTYDKSPIAINGDTISLLNNSTGNVNVYFRTETSWALQQTITNPNTSPTTGDAFGLSQSVYGDRLMIGAYQEDTTATNSGTVYVYLRVNGTWSLEQTLVDPTPASNEFFGKTIFADQDMLFVGSINSIRILFARPTVYSYNSSTKTLTLTGTRSEVNTGINRFLITPTSGYVNNYELRYNATTPLAATSLRNQAVNKI